MTESGTQVYGWDIAAQGLDCPPGFVVRVIGMGQREDRAYWYASREEADTALASPGFLASHGDKRESGSVHVHAGGPARRAWLEPIASVVPAAAPGHIIPEGLPVPLGSSPGPLRLTDEEVRMVTQPAPVAEVKVLDADHVEIYLPKGATLPAEYAGWTGEQSDWDPPSGEQRLHLARPVATPAPTGHIRLAWMALLGAVALLLAAPVAVADPPPAPAPDAGVKSTPRQPTHWERWPQGGPRGGAGDEPSPSTGDRPG